ncbi:expressed unknown protein [Seminavis robusta]|uniref:Uncharacterized protein n=1 Tax=Seminavis robusta TaxID=568900 RepID=A0A9N8DQI3_9STRA|nr:expressed unknown protein [Seminavis robusta]|eukprot:Sro267_g103530.1 n/a (690) ;mRNA; f:68057-70126
MNTGDTTVSSEEEEEDRSATMLPQKRQLTSSWSTRSYEARAELSKMLLHEGPWTREHLARTVAMLQAHPQHASHRFQLPSTCLHDLLRYGATRHYHLGYHTAAMPFPPLCHFLVQFSITCITYTGTDFNHYPQPQEYLDAWVSAIQDVCELFPEALKGEGGSPHDSKSCRNILPLHVACSNPNIPYAIIQYLIQKEPLSIHQPATDGIFPWEVYLQQCILQHGKSNADPTTIAAPDWKDVLRISEVLWSDGILKETDRFGHSHGAAIFGRLLSSAVVLGTVAQPALQVILDKKPYDQKEWLRLSLAHGLNPTVLEGLDFVLLHNHNSKPYKSLCLELPQDALTTLPHSNRTIATIPNVVASKYGLERLRIHLQDLDQDGSPENEAGNGLNPAFVSALASTTNTNLELLELHGSFGMEWNSLRALLQHTTALHLWGCRILLPNNVTTTTIMDEPLVNSRLQELCLNQTRFRIQGNHTSLFEISCLERFFQQLATIPTLTKVHLAMAFRDHFEARHDTTKQAITQAIVQLLEQQQQARVQTLYLMVPLEYKMLWQHLQSNQSLTHLTVLGIQKEALGELVTTVLKNNNDNDNHHNSNRTLQSFDSSIHYRGCEEDEQIQYYLYLNRWRKSIHDARPELDCGAFLELLCRAIMELIDPVTDTTDGRQIAGGATAVTYGLLRENVSLCMTNYF